MGRREYLTKLALGRSALQAPDAQEVTKDRNVGDVDTKTSHVYNELDHQRYDERGRPVNPLSRESKRRLVHAQNDVLATVGVCAKVNERRPHTLGEPLEPRQLQTYGAENESGLELQLLDSAATCMLEPWALGLRHRIQAFSSISKMPLATIIRADWQLKRPLGFLGTGAPSRWVLGFLEFSCDEAFALVLSPEPTSILAFVESYGLSQGLTRNFFRGAVRLLYAASYVMLSPLEVYATLQDLGKADTWPMIPGPRRYMLLVTGLYRGLAPFTLSSPRPGLSYLSSVATNPLFVWAVIQITRPATCDKLYTYIRSALPKPINPDGYSIVAAEGAPISGLRDEDKIYGQEITCFSQVLAKDLQAIGWGWQVTCDAFHAFISLGRRKLSRKPSFSPFIDASKTHSSSASSVPGLPDDLREAMEAMPGANIVPFDSENIEDLRPELQDLLDSMPEDDRSGDRPSPSLTERISSQQAASAETADLNTNLSARPIDEDQRDASPSTPNSSSSTRSRAATPPPLIEITSFGAGAGPVSVNLMLPAEIFDSDHVQQSHTASPDEASSGPASPSVIDRGPHHRVTALSVYAADAIARRLSERFADLLYLPLESLFVRGVALAFWSAPGLVITRGGDILAPGQWFGGGLRTNGRGPTTGYAGKLLLLWGLQVGLDFVGWELTTRLMWWSGLRYYDWRKL